MYADKKIILFFSIKIWFGLEYVCLVISWYKILVYNALFMLPHSKFQGISFNCFNKPSNCIHLSLWSLRFVEVSDRGRQKILFLNSLTGNSNKSSKFLACCCWIWRNLCRFHYQCVTRRVLVIFIIITVDTKVYK